MKQSRPLKVKACSRFLNRRVFIKSKKAQALIDHELDIVRFLRGQFVNKATQKLLFTRFERFLLKNQFKPYVISSRTEPKESNDSDLSFSGYLGDNILSSRYFEELKKGVCGRNETL